jgi:hypothetical protein
MYGMRGYGRPHYYRWHRGPSPFGCLFILPVILLFLVGLTLLKFLWPLLLIGLGFMLLKGMTGGFGSHGGEWGRQQHDWHIKHKNDWDDKPKNDDDDRRYTRTENGDWVEIV